jgi:hypothetical protein
MSLNTVGANQPSLQLIDLFDECQVAIFGFLDLKNLGTVASVCKYFKQIQEEESLWLNLFPPLKHFREDPLGLKKCAGKWLVSLGNKEGLDQCILDSHHKTIILMNFSVNAKSSCMLAMKHPKVPPRSFVVYPDSQQQELGAVIKNQQNVICTVDNVTDTRKFVGLLRWLKADKSLLFHEYKLIV